MTSLGAIQGYLATVQTTMDGLPAALQAAAPTGNFPAVLQSALAVLGGTAGGPAGTTSTAPTPTATASTASQLGLASPIAAPATLATTSPSGAAVVAEAEKFLGVPYVWGGSSPSGFDCSGLVQYVYGQLGVSLPRTSEEQALTGTPVSSIAQAQPGDLVFYAGSDGTVSAPGHVGIYLGNGQMLDAPYTGANVRIDPVGNPVAIRRVLPAATTAPLATASTLGTLPGAAAAGTAALPSSLATAFLSAASRYGVPVSLLTAVAKVESGFTPTAVSSAGAQGLMQLMPQTAASLGVNPFDPAQAIDGAARLLSGYLQQFGSVPDALAAYNAGPNAVTQYGGVPPYPQTQAYVQSVLQAMGSSSGAVSAAATAPAGTIPGAATTSPVTATAATGTTTARLA